MTVSSRVLKGLGGLGIMVCSSCVVPGDLVRVGKAMF